MSASNLAVAAYSVATRLALAVFSSVAERIGAATLPGRHGSS